MIKLTDEQINDKIKYMDTYQSTSVTADASKMDANANVSMKTIVTMEAELYKDFTIQINRQLVKDQIGKDFGSDVADSYIKDIEDHLIYVHDETSIKPYCVAVTMYPLLIDGLKGLGGESKVPKNLTSFNGVFQNFCMMVASQFAGAIATPEYLMYFDHFARKQFGDFYLLNHSDEIAQQLQSTVYILNQPASARGGQSIFWNISLFDEDFFNGIFGDFVFPDGSLPCYHSIRALQDFFLKWQTSERKKAVLTFPVVTTASIVDSEDMVDEKFKSSLTQNLAEGSSFFMYTSETPDSLSSCCRLRNEISDNVFSNSMGAGGVATGSVNVITMNMLRINAKGYMFQDILRRVHKYQVSYRKIVERLIENDMLPAYTAGFITLDKQFSTIGINGMVELAESKGLRPTNNENYKSYVKANLLIIQQLNKEASKMYGVKFNTEFVPAENLGVKNSKWDKKDGIVVNRDCYNSYFYAVESNETDYEDKMILHGRDMVENLDGGSALHLNLDSRPSKAVFGDLIKMSVKHGCNYWCPNTKVTICNDCDYIDLHTRTCCTKCGSKNIDYATRVIGYLKRVSSFSTARQHEHKRRAYQPGK